MTPRTRKLLFYLLAFMFVIAGGSAIFYSQGWRINFSEWKLERTGAIFVKSIPRDAAIALDNQLIRNRTGLLENGTLIEGLLPHTYTLHLEKTGFYPWDKQVTVLPELVSKYEQVVLVPIREAGKVADEKKILPNSIGPTLTFDTQKNSYFFTDNSTPNKKVTNVSALFKTLRLAQLHLSSAASLREALISPSNSNILILLTKESTKGGIYTLNIKTSLLQKISSDSPSALALSTREIVWSTPKGLVTYNYSTTTTIPLASSTATVTKIALSPNGDKVGLLKKNTLSIFDRSRGTLLFTATSSDFEFSPDNQKVAIIKSFEFRGPVVVYDFEKQKEMVFSPVLDEDPDEDPLTSVTHVEWYKDSAHLFLITHADIFFSEIDDVEPLNVRKIATGITRSSTLRNSLHLNPYTAMSMLDTYESVLYRSEDDTLYFTKENTLFGFSFEESDSR